MLQANALLQLSQENGKCSHSLCHQLPPTYSGACQKDRQTVTPWQWQRHSHFFIAKRNSKTPLLNSYRKRLNLGALLICSRDKTWKSLTFVYTSGRNFLPRNNLVYNKSMKSVTINQKKEVKTIVRVSWATEFIVWVMKFSCKWKWSIL